MFRLAIKVGLAAGAVHYVKEAGVWKNSDESVKVYDKLDETFGPLIKEAKTLTNIEFPQLPETKGLCNLSKQYWNQGVSASFLFLSELPSKATKLACEGYRAVVDHPEVKKVLESQSQTQAASDIPQKQKK